MEFENTDDMEIQYKRNLTYRCESCGYVWVEEVMMNGTSFEFEEEKEYFCPMCGGSYVDQI